MGKSTCLLSGRGVELEMHGGGMADWECEVGECEWKSREETQGSQHLGASTVF